MSRIGNRTIIVPEGVTVTEENNVVKVTGPKGTLTQVMLKDITMKQEDNKITLERKNENAKAMHGTMNALIHNMIEGVTKGYEKGLEIQKELYGDEIKDRYRYLPDDVGDALPRFLTEWCFGDCYTRKVLDIPTRELLIFCILTALNASGQLYAHALGNIKVGNSLHTLYYALIQCLPYLGFPCVFNAFNAIKDLAE